MPKPIVTGRTIRSEDEDAIDHEATPSEHRVRLGDWRSPLVLGAWLVSLALAAIAIALLIEIV
jgi:hypothetical protein